MKKLAKADPRELASKNKDSDSSHFREILKNPFLASIIETSVGYYEVNISRDLILNDFTICENGKDIPVLEKIGFESPCSFSAFSKKWYETMISDAQKENASFFLNMRALLLDYYAKGLYEVFFNYWTNSLTAGESYITQRFVMFKDENGDILALSVCNDLTKMRLEQEKAETDLIESYAFMDNLTGGDNYNKFKENMKKVKAPGFIVALDLHDFKLINSVCGIKKTDEFLKNFWKCIESAKGRNDIAAHIYADHFVLYTDTRNRNSVENLIESIQVAENLLTIEMGVPQITLYCGISKWEQGKGLELSYSEAVAAKRKIKDARSKAFEYFDEADTERMIREKNLEDSFENALESREFEIWYQPKFSPASRKIVGAEALVRWRKNGELVPPMTFIPILERNGKIRELDEYVFRNVCYQQKLWQTEGIKIVPVSVNLSRASMYYKSVVGKYSWIVSDAGISQKMVPIEITESAAINNSDVKIIANTFYRAGFSLHLDDFGSGYSSLSTLNELHFDTLKIDKSLVDYIGNPGGDKLLEHTVSLALELGMHVTAEGVEYEWQNSYLRHIGCESIQGFLFSKPIKKDEFEILLKNNIDKKSYTEDEYAEEYVNKLHRAVLKSSLYDCLVDLTDDTFRETIGRCDWFNDEKLHTLCYSEGVKNVAENLILPEYKEDYRKIMDRESLIKSYNGKPETKVFYYKRCVEGKKTNARLVIHLFKIKESKKLWMYVNVTVLDAIK